VIDHARADEIDFVEGCWKDSQRSYYDGVPSKWYYRSMRATVRGHIARSLVLVDRSADGVALGYIVAERVNDSMRVHHLYVRKDFRQEGRGLALLAKACEMLGGDKLEYTCRVMRARKYEERRPWTVARWCKSLGAKFVVGEEAARESA